MVDKRTGSRDATQKGKTAIDPTKAHCVWPVVKGKTAVKKTRKEIELEQARIREQTRTGQKPPR